jgi:hypothetical protein
MASRDETKRQSSDSEVVSAMLDGARRPAVRPASTAERWAHYVFRACAAAGDLKTLDAWAACVGVSYTSLRETCSLLGIRPHDARDLTRMLRAVMRSTLDDCPPSALLDVSDSRTLRMLLERSGVAGGAWPVAISVEQFLSRQGSSRLATPAFAFCTSCWRTPAESRQWALPRQGVRSTDGFDDSTLGEACREPASTR